MRHFISIAALTLAVSALPAFGQSSNGNSDASQGPNGTNAPQPGAQPNDAFRNRSGATMHPTGSTAYNRPSYDSSATGKAGGRANGTNPNAQSDTGVDRNSAGTSGSSFGVPGKGP